MPEVPALVPPTRRTQVTVGQETTVVAHRGVNELELFDATEAATAKGAIEVARIVALLRIIFDLKASR